MRPHPFSVLSLLTCAASLALPDRTDTATGALRSRRSLLGDVVDELNAAAEAVDLLAKPGPYPQGDAFPASAADCTDVIVIYARGTAEPGPIGETVGPVFEDLLRPALVAAGNKTLGFIGLSEYAATFLGYFGGGDASGSKEMAQKLAAAATLCPRAAIISAGYSQGGQLVHNSAKLLSTATAEHIKAVVIFGDPDDGQPVQGISSSNTDVICHPVDAVCKLGRDGVVGAPFILLTVWDHLNYEKDVKSAVEYVAARV